MSVNSVNGAPSTSDQFLAGYAELEAIDFFLAQALQQHLDARDPLCFHLWLALHWALRQGHSCLDLAAIAGRTLWAEPGPEAGTGRPGYRFADLNSLRAQLAQLDLAAQADRAVVAEGDRLYLRRYWQFERELAEWLRARLQPRELNATEREAARRMIGLLFPEAPVNGQAHDRVDWQAVAVANAVTRPFCIVSGGPGTGKTYTVTRLLATLQAVAGGALRIQMAAPTGKAKQRLQESISAARAQLAATGLASSLLGSIPDVAHTLHGLLGVRPNSSELRHHADNPLPVDLLLIDEASMVDLPMMTRVTRALPAGARLVLVGDANQLPSIAVGSVLSDLAPLPHRGYSASAADLIHEFSGYRVRCSEDDSASEDHVCVLRRSHRFEGGGGIGQLAEAVLGLDVEASWQQLGLAGAEGPAAVAGQIGHIAPPALAGWLESAVRHYFLGISRAADLASAFQLLARFRVLVPTRVGDMGVTALNERIESLLARDNASIQSDRHYHGRPVMVTRNHHALNVFNGDVGLVWARGDGVLEACFEQAQGVRRINLGLLTEVEPVYAMTIHKTQGSEFEHVALLLPDSAAAMLSPELIYTGITRARQRCVICTGEKLWRDALSRRALRWSGLKLSF